MNPDTQRHRLHVDYNHVYRPHIHNGIAYVNRHRALVSLMHVRAARRLNGTRLQNSRPYGILQDPTCRVRRTTIEHFQLRCRDNDAVFRQLAENRLMPPTADRQTRRRVVRNLQIVLNARGHFQ